MSELNSNINTVTRRNQTFLFILILFSIMTAGAGIYYVNEMSKKKSDSDPIFEDETQLLEPNLTGAVTSTFDGQISAQIVTDVQTESKANRETLNSVLNKLKSMEENLETQKKENESLRKEIEDSKKAYGDLMDSVANQPIAQQEESFEFEQDFTTSRGKMTQKDGSGQANYQLHDGYVELTQPKPVQGAFERKVYTKKNSKANASRFYVPSGAFSKAIILEGADASAAVTAKQAEAVPMQFKLEENLHLPNNKKSNKLTGCFVTAGTYGDISSERSIVRLNNLSCLINGRYVDQKVSGHVAFYGKNGIKGEPVMRNGKILGLAFGAGALGGVGSAVSAIGDTQVGVGAARTIGGAEVLREALGGGTTSAANKLADYYIQRAEQYHPVIPIGSANRIEVIFTKGFWLKFVDENEEPSKSTESENGEQQTESNNVVPRELEDQLGDIRKQQLSDFVTPNQPIK